MYAIKNYNTNQYLGKDGFTHKKANAALYDTFSKAELARKQKGDYLVTIIINDDDIKSKSKEG